MAGRALAVAKVVSAATRAVVADVAVVVVVEQAVGDVV